MNAEDLAFDQGANAEIVEYFGAVLPGVDVAILAHSLLVETVDGCNTASLVVASQKRDAVGVLQLKAKQKLECFYRVVATIDEVTHENVAGVRDLTTFFEKFEQVVELAVDVTANRDWRAHWLNIALFDQDLLNLLTEDA